MADNASGSPDRSARSRRLSLAAAIAITIAGAAALACPAFESAALAAGSGVAKPVIFEGSQRFEADLNGIYQPSTRIGDDQPRGVAVDGTGRIYSLNPGTNTITVYGRSESGALALVATIGGPDTQLWYPSAIAVDSQGKIYVLSGVFRAVSYAVSILIFPAGSSGDTAPMATISWSGTSFGVPLGIAADGSGSIYVSGTTGDFSIGTDHGEVVIFGPGSSGNAAPKAILNTGPIGLLEPNLIAVDAVGNIYLAGWDVRLRIVEYAAGAQGSAAPIATISGPSTGFPDRAGAIAVDASGRVFATTYTSSSYDHSPQNVLVFAPGSNGNAAPIATIGFDGTEAAFPLGIAVDPSGNVYVANFAYEGTGGNSITVYGPSSSEKAQPLATLTRGQTGFAVSPYAVATDPVGNVYAEALKGNLDSCGPVELEILEFAPGTTDAPPIRSMVDPKPSPDVFDGWCGGRLYNPYIAVDAEGNAYILKSPDPSLISLEETPLPATGAIEKFAPSAAGKAARIATISGPRTGLTEPTGIAVDRAGNIFVTNYRVLPTIQDYGLRVAGSILVYKARSHGDAVPKVFPIRRALLLGQGPTAVAIDTDDNIYVGFSEDSSSIEVYRSKDLLSDGPLNGFGTLLPRPVRQIKGSKTGLANPVGIAIDASGDVWVQNQMGPAMVYRSHANGNVEPVMTVDLSNYEVRLNGRVIAPFVLSQQSRDRSGSRR